VPREDWDSEEEDWTDDIDDPDADDADESAVCPECGGTMFLGADKCPACGYWLSAADRRALGTDSSQPRLIKIVAVALSDEHIVGLEGGLVGGGGLGYYVVAGFSQSELFGKGLAAGIAIKVAIFAPPPDCPKIITLFASPPFECRA
jgi:hypothetical protein